MEQYTFRTDEFREPPFESRQIHPFCELSPDALPRLNQSLGLDMSVAVFAAIQAVYRERELREPLVGEVRLLATLHSLTASDAARVGVGEVCTDSDAVAEMWADLMARRRLLAGIVPDHAKCFRHRRSPRFDLRHTMPGHVYLCLLPSPSGEGGPQG